MATHDYNIENASGASFRADLNFALDAIKTNNSKTADPDSNKKFAFMWHVNSSTGIVKINNSDSSKFVPLFQINNTGVNTTATHFLHEGSVGGPALCFRQNNGGNDQFDTDTGIFQRADNEFNISTAGVERFRITSDGFTKATNTGTVHGTTSFHESLSTNNNQHCHVFSHHGSTQLEQLGILVRTLNDPGGTQTLIKCDTGSTVRFVVRKNGVVANQSGSFSQISDVKLKENIVDANSQWNDIKAVKVRNYNFKKEPNIKMLGVVAQEIETVSAGLVTDVPDLDPNTNEDLGTVTKEVKQSILYMKALKALQEAMARIETLEAKVATLEGS